MFEFYEARLEHDRLVVLVDLNASEHAPVPSHPYRLEILVPMLEPRSDGLRSNEEAPALFALEETKWLRRRDPRHHPAAGGGLRRLGRPNRVRWGDAVRSCLRPPRLRSAAASNHSLANRSAKVGAVKMRSAHCASSESEAARTRATIVGGGEPNRSCTS